MGYIATDLGRIPAAGFQWYTYVLSDGWNDPLRDELARNFDRFAAAVSPNCLVVRGAEPEAFYNAFLDSQLMALAQRGHLPLPAVVVSNRTPHQIDDSTGIKNLEAVKILTFPLSKRYVKPGSITEFLKALAETLKDGGAEDIDDQTLRSKWRWIVEYLELKPNFCGLGVNFNKVLDDLFAQKTTVHDRHGA